MRKASSTMHCALLSIWVPLLLLASFSYAPSVLATTTEISGALIKKHSRSVLRDIRESLCCAPSSRIPPVNWWCPSFCGISRRLSLLKGLLTFSPFKRPPKLLFSTLEWWPPSKGLSLIFTLYMHVTVHAQSLAPPAAPTSTVDHSTLTRTAAASHSHSLSSGNEVNTDEKVVNEELAKPSLKGHDEEAKFKGFFPKPIPIVKPIPKLIPIVKPIPKPIPIVKPIPIPVYKPIPKPIPIVKPIPKPIPVTNPIPIEEEKFKGFIPKPIPIIKPTPKIIPIVKPIPIPVYKPIPKPIPVVKPIPIIKPVPKIIPVVKPIPIIKPVPKIIPVVKPIPIIKPVPKPIPIIKPIPKPFIVKKPIPTVESEEFLKPKPFFKKPIIPKPPLHPKFKKPLLPPLPIHKPIPTP